jgi:hypothetical protein
MKTLQGRHDAGEKREQIVAAILKRFFKGQVKIELIGKLGLEVDAYDGIDLKLIYGDRTETAQVKPFQEKIVDEENGTITLLGTAQVQPYTTDLMIFQKGRNVLIFNKPPKIVDGNYVFPIDGLKLNIE